MNELHNLVTAGALPAPIDPTFERVFYITMGLTGGIAAAIIAGCFD